MQVSQDTRGNMLEPTNLLEDWLLDWQIFSLQHRYYPNREYLWQKFTRM